MKEKARCKGTCDGNGPVYEGEEGLLCQDCYPPWIFCGVHNKWYPRDDRCPDCADRDFDNDESPSMGDEEG